MYFFKKYLIWKKHIKYMKLLLSFIFNILQEFTISFFIINIFSVLKLVFIKCNRNR